MHPAVFQICAATNSVIERLPHQHFSRPTAREPRYERLFALCHTVNTTITSCRLLSPHPRFLSPSIAHLCVVLSKRSGRSI